MRELLPRTSRHCYRHLHDMPRHALPSHVHRHSHSPLIAFEFQVNHSGNYPLKWDSYLICFQCHSSERVSFLCAKWTPHYKRPTSHTKQSPKASGSTRGLRGILKRIQHPLFTLWIVNQKHESLGNKHKKFVLGVFSHAGISFSYNKLPTRFDRNNFPQLNFFLFSNQNEKDFPPMGEISHINNDFIM